VIHLLFDGACSPTNPGGTETWGWVVRVEGGSVASGRGIAAEHGGTCNRAEYAGLLAGLEALGRLGLDGPVEVSGDSRLVVNQMSGAWVCRSEVLRPLWRRAVALAEELDVRWRWVPRTQNEEADRLARLAYEEWQADSGSALCKPTGSSGVAG
jgi:ribonuclease HI